MKLALFVAIITPFLIPSLIFAQSVTGANPFSVSLDTRFPLPYSSVTLTPTTGSLDITTATMLVSVGGKQLYQGAAQAISVPLGGAGIPIVIKVIMRSRGTDFPITLSVVPQDVSLVAEPLGTTPSLYVGKSPVPLEGTVRVVAVANLRTATGRNTDPTTASYIWTVDGAVATNFSGVGKNAINVPSPLQYRNRTVSVTVTSSDGALIGGGTISLRATEPVIRVYEQDPLLGVRFERALAGDHIVSSSESSLFAAPFSFSTVRSPLIEWFLNGDAVENGSSITLRPAGEGRGSANVSVVTSSGETLAATEQVTISFERRSGTSLFGL